MRCLAILHFKASTHLTLSLFTSSIRVPTFTSSPRHGDGHQPRNPAMNTRNIVLASLLAASTFASLAQGVFQHPAVATPPQAAGVDPSTFIVGHPASPSWQVRHANADHPAIVMRREVSRHVI